MTVTLEGFIKALDEREELLTEFDERLWLSIVHQVKVTKEGKFVLYEKVNLL